MGGLLKWVGNKSNFAKEIVSYFPLDFNGYIEPFVGGGAVIKEAPRKVLVAADILCPLIDFWVVVRDNPQQVISDYVERYDFLNSGDKVKNYMVIRDRYNLKPNAADLVLLSRACYGGVIRFRKSDGAFTTGCGPHALLKPESFKRRVLEWSDHVRDVSFVCQSYEQTLALAELNDLVYCDPPYLNSHSILYGAQDFNWVTFLDYVRDCIERGVYVALTVNGRGDLLEKLCDLLRPLFPRSVCLSGRPLMLKRFQLKDQRDDVVPVRDLLFLSW